MKKSFLVVLFIGLLAGLISCSSNVDSEVEPSDAQIIEFFYTDDDMSKPYQELNRLYSITVNDVNGPYDYKYNMVLTYHQPTTKVVSLIMEYNYNGSVKTITYPLSNVDYTEYQCVYWSDEYWTADISGGTYNEQKDLYLYLVDSLGRKSQKFYTIINLNR